MVREKQAERVHTSQPDRAWLVSAAKNRESTLVGSSWDLMNWHAPCNQKIHFKNQRKITTVLPCSLYISWSLFRGSVSTRPHHKYKVRSRRWFSYVLIRHSGPELSQTDHRVVRGLQVGELLAQEVLQSGHVRQGEVVRRRQRLSSGESQAEEEQPEKPCGQCHTLARRSGEVLIHLVSPWKRDNDAF